MEIDKNDLIARFAALSDEELLRRVGAGTLTPLADEVARGELTSRGVQAPALAEPEVAEHSTESVETPPDDIDLVTLFRTNNVLNAHVIRMHLDSEGIFAYLWGEHLGTAHIIFSAATGGMRLQVRSDQLKRAREVLAAFQRGDYALDEREPPE
jgi:hypothetical protein